MKRDTWVPIEREKDIICNYIGCMAGMGLAGNGHCYLEGNPYIKECPKYQDHDEIMKQKESNMKITCKIFGHKWKYYKKSGDVSLFRACARCGHLAYKNASTPGWTSLFLQARNYKDIK